MNVVILDISLTDVSGVEVLRQIKPDKPAVPVVALSPYADPSYVDAVRTVGAAGFLTKSVAPDELVNAIKVSLEGGILFPAE